MNTVILYLVLTNKLITFSKKFQDYKPREGGDMATNSHTPQIPNESLEYKVGILIIN